MNFISFFLTMSFHISKTQKNLLLIDIDNTLLIPQNIFIYYKKDDISITYSPEEYAKLDVANDQKKYFDYRDFRDKDAITKSIQLSIPLYHNLKIINEYIKNNWELGILTARGQEDLIAEITPKWMSRHLNVFKMIKRSNIIGVNDKSKMYEGNTDSEKKLLVLKIYIKNEQYDNITFIDDNVFTIELIDKYNKQLPKNKKIKLILAT